MIHLHMEPDVSSIRVYGQPGGYKQRMPYLAIFQIKHLTEKVVYLCGAVGKIDRETRAAVLDLLLQQGVTTVMVERRGKMKTYELQPVLTGCSSSGKRLSPDCALVSVPTAP